MTSLLSQLTPSRLRKLLFQSSLALSITSGLSYFFGFIRDRILTNMFGAGNELDVYNAAFVIPEFILAIFITSALSAAFIPLFTEYATTDKDRSIRYANQILHFSLLILIVIGSGIAIALPFIAHLLVPGFSDAQTDQYVLMTRILLFTPLLFAASNIFGGVLISIRGFFWYGMAPILYNIGIIFGIFIFVPFFGIYGLALGAVLGTFLHMSIRLIAIFVFKALYWKPCLNIDKDLRETMRLMLPKMFQIGMWQILLFWFIRLASQLPEGSITVYSLARNFQSVPVSLIGIAIALAAFSTLSHLAAEKKYTEFHKTLKKRAFLILYTTLPAALLLAVISHPLISILFKGGKFDEQAVAFTAIMLSVYCISIPFESLMHIFARAHYALKNTLRPSLIHITAILIIMLLSGILINIVGLYAIPISFSVGLAIQVVMLWLSYKNISIQHVKKL